MYYQNKKSVSSKKRIYRAGVVALALLLIAGGVYWFGFRNTNSEQAAKTDAQIETELGREQSNDKPGVQDEGAQNGSSNNGTSTDKNGSPSIPSTGQNVTPVITFADYSDSSKQTVEVDAFVPGIFETGTCTLTLTQGSRTITKQTAAAGNATTTSCANFFIPKAEFATGGVWNAVVTYKSSAHSGSSSTVKVNV